VGPVRFARGSTDHASAARLRDDPIGEIIAARSRRPVMALRGDSHRLALSD
ncbi:MAG: hypothetical protein JWQ16_2781, partial [Novosphingobium sp.]|nr:hypothetical protein [Novosphingobium sp.]